MSPASLSDLYCAYIACLNRQDWVHLGSYVDDEVEHNGRPLKLSGYRAMLMNDFEDIPDLRLNIQLLISSPPNVAARLAFKCSPKGKFLGMNMNGRLASFAENVFYEFEDSKIRSVWSVIDKNAIEAQLPPLWAASALYLRGMRDGWRASCRDRIYDPGARCQTLTTSVLI